MPISFKSCSSRAFGTFFKLSWYDNSSWLMSRRPRSWASSRFRLLQVAADRVARLGRRHEVHPARVRTRAALRDDFDRFAVLELRLQRHGASIDLGGHAAIADVRMHGVGEVHGGGAARQPQDGALRRKHVNLVGEQVRLDGLEELLGVRRTLHLHEPREPFARALFGAVRVLVDGLVLPVRCDAALGDLLHALRADLHFERQAVRPEQRGVQRLVAVDARNRDVVLESPRHRLEQLMRDPEGAIAMVDVVDNDAHAVDVDDVGQDAPACAASSNRCCRDASRAPPRARQSWPPRALH